MLQVFEQACAQSLCMHMCAKGNADIGMLSMWLLWSRAMHVLQSVCVPGPLQNCDCQQSNSQLSHAMCMYNDRHSGMHRC